MISERCCLLVDDDPEDQEFFIDVLHEVTTRTGCYAVSSGEEALIALDQETVHPDVVVTDLNMPGMNGIEFLKKLRAMPKYKDVPAFIYTSHFTDEQMQRAKALGVKTIISKAHRNAIKKILKQMLPEAVQTVL